MGDFEEALRTDRELLRTILSLQRAFYECWGRWPSVQEIASQLHPRPLT